MRLLAAREEAVAVAASPNAFERSGRVLPRETGGGIAFGRHCPPPPKRGRPARGAGWGSQAAFDPSPDHFDAPTLPFQVRVIQYAIALG